MEVVKTGEVAVGVITVWRVWERVLPAEHLGENTQKFPVV